ncbi:MAG: LysM peptidoglycan-binding domain-containing protein [Akkermansiaceae bacterium]
MNKPIQIKRNKPANSHYRVLYAKTGRKRRLHAATAATADQHSGMGADVPNISVGRALFVILILHVLAVAAIYIHSAFFGDGRDVSANEGQPALVEQNAAPVAPVTIPAKKQIEKKVVSQVATGRHMVVMGDTYQVIAQKHNVSERALRALNGNVAIRAGIVLDLPAELSARPVNPAPAAVAETVVADSKPKAMPKSKPKQVAQEEQKPLAIKPKKQDQLAKASVVESSPAPAAPVPSKSSQHDVSNAPKALVIEPAIQDSGKTYTIKPGDTLWGISSRLKVSRHDLLELNQIKDANKLYAGRTIKIPAK